MTIRKINGNTYSEFAIVAAEPIPVDIEGATLSLTADGIEIKNDVGNPIPVNDAGGSLTVDSPQLTSIDGKLPALVGGRVPVDVAAISLGDVEIKNDTGNPIPVADAGSSLTVDSKAYRATVSITRPSNTTQYTAGDVIGIADGGTPANAGSAIHALSAIGPSGGFVLIQSAALIFSDAAMISGMAAFRVHLYSASPTAILDNAAFDLVSGDRASYVGYIDLPAPIDLGSSLYTQADSIGRLVKLAAASTSLFAQIETRGTYTPASGSTIELRLSTMEAGL